MYNTVHNDRLLISRLIVCTLTINEIKMTAIDSCFDGGRHLNPPNPLTLCGIYISFPKFAV